MNIKPVLGNDKQTGMRRIAAAAIVLSFVSFVLVAMFDRVSQNAGAFLFCVLRILFHGF